VRLVQPVVAFGLCRARFVFGSCVAAPRVAEGENVRCIVGVRSVFALRAMPGALHLRLSVAAPRVAEGENVRCIVGVRSVFALRATPDTLHLRLSVAAPRVADGENVRCIVGVRSVFVLRATPDTLHLRLSVAAPRVAEGEAWSQAGSNRRPRHCERRALPSELWPPRDRLDGGRQSPPFTIRANAKSRTPKSLFSKAFAGNFPCLRGDEPIFSG
jgi:hypothetical protein